ncbi:hypothetical protein [Sulfuriflexus mobilis]|uniref:hypothetical protein n=1 Tax=Sulfuriflexus mobilis TaxID=1811807 RepID=UPI000F8473E8|nr:hypothetical protein [Sulfuriflexus mobilis]
MMKQQSSSGTRLFVSALLLYVGVSLMAHAYEDPTRPPDFAGTGADTQQLNAPVWQLSSILISAERRLAVINGQTVRQGEQIGNARVIRIGATGVTLRNNTETFTVKLLSLPVKSVSDK